jgi:valyl-tRNA synthetase
MDNLQALVTGLRQFRAEHGLSPRRELAITLRDPEQIVGPWWPEQLATLASALPTVADSAPAGRGFTRIVAGSVEAFVELDDLIDVEAERDRLEKRLGSASDDLARSQKKLANESFVAKAPPEVVEKERSKAAELADLVGKLTAQLSELGT